MAHGLTLKTINAIDSSGKFDRNMVVHELVFPNIPEWAVVTENLDRRHMTLKDFTNRVLPRPYTGTTKHQEPK